MSGKNNCRIVVKSVRITKPEYAKEVTLSNGDVFHVSLIADFKVGDEVRIFNNEYGSICDDGMITRVPGIEKMSKDNHPNVEGVV